MIYEPPSEIRPLLLRRPRWAGGLMVLARLVVAVLGVPLVFGACVLLQEAKALSDGPNP